MPYLRTDTDTVYACPECDSAGNVHKREDLKRSNGSKPYACHDCSAEFDAPVERDAREWQPQRDASDRAWAQQRAAILERHGLLEDGG